VEEVIYRNKGQRDCYFALPGTSLYKGWEEHGIRWGDRH